MCSETGVGSLIAHIRRKKAVKLYLDTTGSVVFKTPDQKKHVLYYALVLAGHGPGAPTFACSRDVYEQPNCADSSPCGDRLGTGCSASLLEGRYLFLSQEMLHYQPGHTEDEDHQKIYCAWAWACTLSSFVWHAAEYANSEWGYRGIRGPVHHFVCPKIKNKKKTPVEELTEMMCLFVNCNDVMSEIHVDTKTLRTFDSRTIVSTPSFSSVFRHFSDDE